MIRPSPLLLRLIPVLALSGTACAAGLAPVVLPRFVGPLPAAEAAAIGTLPYSPGDVALAWLPDDSLLVAHMEIYRTVDALAGTCAGTGFYKVPAAGGNPRMVAAGERACFATRTLPAAAADGSSVVFAVLGDRGARFARYTLATNRIDTLTTGCVNHRFPAVSPRGGRIAWGGCAAGEDGIWIARADGGDAHEISPPTHRDTRYPSWSPDGATLAYGVGPGPSPRRIALVDTLGAGRVLGVAGDNPSWSPDGRWIAFLADPVYPCLNSVRLVRPDGTEERTMFVNEVTTTFSVGAGVAREGQSCGPLVWSPDSSTLLFPRYFVGGESVWGLDVASGRTRPVTSPEGPR